MTMSNSPACGKRATDVGSVALRRCGSPACEATVRMTPDARNPGEYGGRVRLADAPEHDAADEKTLTLSTELLRGDPRLEALFAPFRACVVLHETLIHEGSAARASR